MRLLSLKLDQFRNYEQLSLDCSGNDRYLLIGPNGSGKTNILEAISILSLSKSGLGSEDEHLVQWETDFCRVTGQCVTDDGQERLLEVVVQLRPRRQKACFVNDVRVSVAELVGKLPTVLFLPQDLSLFSGPPAERRRFFDQLLSQVDPSYLHALSDYQKFLKQRNALLKAIRNGLAKEDELDTWETLLAERAAPITVARLELLETFGLTLLEELRTLGEEWPDARIIYERSAEFRDIESITIELTRALRASRSRDLELQTTTVGPHRDDWYVTVGSHELSTFASRGQQRAVVLALLFLQASYLELKKAERPIILLDDVFSELDDRHQEGVLQAFESHQVFITGTHEPWQKMGAEVRQVKAGVIEGNRELGVGHPIP